MSTPTAGSSGSATGPEGAKRRVLNRRTVLATAAWAAPAITVASAAPALAVSGSSSMTVGSASGDSALRGGHSPTGTVLVFMTPNPASTPVPVVTYTDAGATTSSYVFVSSDATSGTYQLQFTTTTSPLPPTVTATIAVTGYGSVAATVRFPGTRDTTFANPKLGNTANAVAVQSDGKSVVTGAFATAGVSSTTRGRLARFNATGTLDTTFADPNLGNSGDAVAVQADGKVVVAGVFGTAGFGNTTRGKLARFNTDGTLDTTFADPNLDSPCLGVAVQTDGKVLVAGYFGTAGASSTTMLGLARFNTDGTLDTTFADPNLSLVSAVAVQADGKILAAGSFSNAGADGTPMDGLARFNTDGTLDTTFANPSLTSGATASAVAVQGDGKVLVAGSFTTAGAANTTMGHLARFNTDGTLDTTFANPNLNGTANAVAVQGDGKVLVAGAFTAGPANTTMGRLARFNTDGTLDTTFANPNLNGTANAVAVQGDGRVLVAGAFTAAGAANTTMGRLARFNA